jgi:hypothetical protein
MTASLLWLERPLLALHRNGQTLFLYGRDQASSGLCGLARLRGNQIRKVGHLAGEVFGHFLEAFVQSLEFLAVCELGANQSADVGEDPYHLFCSVIDQIGEVADGRGHGPQKPTLCVQGDWRETCRAATLRSPCREHLREVRSGPL